jgi:hypothetical protein
MNLSTVKSPSIWSDKQEGRDWRSRALCSQPDSDPELWWDPDRLGQSMARHMCLTHCPVRQQCLTFYVVSGGETAGGITYKQNGQPVKVQPRVAPRCWRCVPTI